MTHSRPVENGAPVKIWALTCPSCEDFLRHDSSWSATAAELPETHDERVVRERDERLGKLDRENQLAEAIIRLGALGDLPQAIGQMLGPVLGTTALPGLMECPNGHGQAPGQKFCGECGAAMSRPVAKAAIRGAEPAPAAPVARPAGPRQRLRDANLRTLQALARSRHLDADGTRPELIARLSAAGVTSNDLAGLQ